MRVKRVMADGDVKPQERERERERDIALLEETPVTMGKGPSSRTTGGEPAVFIGSLTDAQHPRAVGGQLRPAGDARAQAFGNASA